MLRQMNSALTDSIGSHSTFHNWLIDICYSDKSEEEKERLRQNPPDILEWIAGWAKAKEMHFFLERLPAEERAKPENSVLRNGRTFDDLVEREISMYGALASKSESETYGPILRQVLKDQLKRAIKDWRSIIDQVIEHGYSEDDFYMYDAGDLCDRRDLLEYCHQGIQHLRDEGILEDLGDEQRDFRVGIKANDPYFEKALGDERCPKVAADKAYWWRHKGKSPPGSFLHPKKEKPWP